MNQWLKKAQKMQKMCPTYSGRQLALTAEHQNAQQRQTQEEEKNENTEERTQTQKNAQKHTKTQNIFHLQTEATR